MLEGLGDVSGHVLARLRELFPAFMAAELSRLRAGIVDEQYGRPRLDPVPGYGCIFGGERLDSDRWIRAGGDPGKVRKLYAAGGLLFCAAAILPAPLVTTSEASIVLITWLACSWECLHRTFGRSRKHWQDRWPPAVDRYPECDRQPRWGCLAVRDRLDCIGDGLVFACLCHGHGRASRGNHCLSNQLGENETYLMDCAFSSKRGGDMKIESAGVLSTLADLVSINSINPAYEHGRPEEGVATHIQSFFDNRGVETFRQQVMPGRSNVIARLPGRNRASVW